MKKILAFVLTLSCGVISSCNSQSMNVLITSESIGPVNLGDSMDNLRKILPTSEYNYKAEEYMVDAYGCIISNKKTGEELLIVGLDEETYQTCEGTINLIRTSNKIFKTAENIGPGSLIADAETKYGKASLTYHTENESREGVSFEKSLNNAWFIPSPPDQNDNFAGIYTPTMYKDENGEEYEDSLHETSSYKQGAYIDTISID